MLKKLFMTAILTVGFALIAFGQNDDKKNPPPKSGDKPVVVPKDKEKPKDNPTPKPTPKKPESHSLGDLIQQVLIG